MNDTRSPFPFFSSSSMSRTECRYGTLTSDVPCSTSSGRSSRSTCESGDAFAPVAAIADAAAVIGRDHDVALLQQVLMEAVIHGVVPLHVPTVVVLVHAVAVDPDDGRVLLRSIEVLRHEQPRGHLLAVGAG